MAARRPQDRSPARRPAWRLSPSLGIALCLLAAFGAGVALTRQARAEARLLRADPDSPIADAGLRDRALARGRQGFQAHCAQCHGRDARGERSLAAPDLTDADWLYGEGRVSDIERVVFYGIRAKVPKTWSLADMPAFARPVPYPREPAIAPLSPSDIRDVVAFLRRLEGQSADPLAAGRGAALYGDRGACYDCHSSDARGDRAVGAPNLTDPLTLYGASESALFNTVAYGRAGYCPAWKDVLKPGQIRDIALFVHALEAPNAAAGGSGKGP